MSAASTKGLSGRTVLLSLLTFFGVIIGVNILMATYAVNTFDGQFEEDAYRNGLNFNERIEASRAQADIGWEAGVSYSAGDKTLRLELVDANAAPLVGAQLDALLWRQTTQGMDVPLSFQERGNGVYVANIPGGQMGRFELRLTASKNAKRVMFKRSLDLSAQGGAS